MKPVTDDTIERLVAFHGHSPEDYRRLALDAQAACWVLYDHLVGDERLDVFRWEVRERWDAMNGARRSKFRRKGVPWLREVYTRALAKSFA